MTTAVVVLYGLAGVLGAAGLTYALRTRPRGQLRTAAAAFLGPAVAYAAAHLTATATATPQRYDQAPITAWAELAGRLGFWLGLAAAIGTVLSLVQLRNSGRG